MEQRFTVITLGVQDLQSSRDFYETVLGFKPSSASQEGIAFYQTGCCVLSLYPRKDLADDIGLEEKGPLLPGSFALAHNVRSREEVDTILAEIEAKGGQILKAPQEVFWGGYSGYFQDPDGHAWEVAHNPFWELADDGSVRLPE